MAPCLNVQCNALWRINKGPKWAREKMILLGLGANLPHPAYGPPRETLEAALAAIEAAGAIVARRSPWFRTPPWPPSDQPWYVNGVAQLETDLKPGSLMTLLHGVEREFGRTRGRRNEARVLDLDLLAYGERISAPGEQPELPHPRLADRGFVLLPLASIAPDWRHPVSGETLAVLIERLPASERQVEALD